MIASCSLFEIYILKIVLVLLQIFISQQHHLLHFSFHCTFSHKSKMCNRENVTVMVMSSNLNNITQIQIVLTYLFPMLITTFICLLCILVFLQLNIFRY